MSHARGLAVAVLAAAAIQAAPATAATVWRGAPIVHLAADGPRVAIVTTPRGTTCSPVRLVDLRSGWAPIVAGRRSLTCRALAASSTDVPVDVGSLVLSGRRALWTLDAPLGARVLDALSGDHGATTGVLFERAPRRRGRIVQVASAFVQDPAGNELAVRGGGDAVVVTEAAWALECDPECVEARSTRTRVLRPVSGRAPVEIPAGATLVAAWPDRLLLDRGDGLELVDDALGRRARLAPTGPLVLSEVVRDGAALVVLTQARELVRFDVATGVETARQALATPGILVAVRDGTAVLSAPRVLRAVRLADGRARVLLRLPEPGFGGVAETAVGIAWTANRAGRGRVGVVPWAAIAG